MTDSTLGKHKMNFQVVWRGRGKRSWLSAPDGGSGFLLGEIAGGGSWETLRTDAISLSLDQLMRAKIAAGRPKDLEAIAELEAIREERGGQP